MKDFFGSEFSRYDSSELACIGKALNYELCLYRIYIIWNVFFMLAGVMVVYKNLYTTFEMLAVLGLFWGVSGLPFFLLRDLAKGKFAGSLPDNGNGSGLNPILMLFKLTAGFALGSWATHVMLIATVAKYFELRGYRKALAAALA